MKHPPVQIDLMNNGVPSTRPGKLEMLVRLWWEMFQTVQWIAAWVHWGTPRGASYNLTTGWKISR